MGTTEAITGAEWLARTLAANGTTHVFFIDAVLRRTLIELGVLGVTRVLAHAEKSAAYMADGYARIAGRPGICFAQSVGAANLAAGLQDAWLGHSPVIALTGREPPLFHHRNTYQELPHGPLYASVTKFSADVADAADLPRLLRQAWREAMTGSPRPAHLDLYGRSANIVETGMVSEPTVADPALQLTMPPYRPTPSDDEIERAAAKLLAAKRIAIVAGSGAAASGAGPELLALGEALAAPIGTSLGGRGLIPTQHRLSIGCPGNYAAPPTNQIVHEADLVLFVGCHTGDQVTHTWRIPSLDTEVVQIDIDPLEPGRSYRNTLGLMGDPKATLAKLNAAIGRPARDTDVCRSCGRHRSCLARGARTASRQQCCTNPARPAVRRDHPRAARGRHPGRRHRLFRHLDLDADRAERHSADLSARRRFTWLVVPGVARCEVRGGQAQGDLLVGRRRDLLSPDRA